MQRTRQYRIVRYPSSMGHVHYYVEERGLFGWREVYGTETRAGTADEAYRKYLHCKEPTSIVREWSEA